MYSYRYFFTVREAFLILSDLFLFNKLRPKMRHLKMCINRNIFIVGVESYELTRLISVECIVNTFIFASRNFKICVETQYAMTFFIGHTHA